MSVRVLIVQLDVRVPPGKLLEWCAAAGAQVEVITAGVDAIPERLDGYGGLICLGGFVSATDPDRSPWLPELRRLLVSATADGLAVLGICLGAQLLAAAHGGVVGRMGERPEVGPSLVAKRDAAEQDALFAELPWTPDVLQFHRDEVVTLPPGARLLLSSPRCAHQAFRIGRAAYGVQFHFETTAELVLEWVAARPGMAEHARPGVLTPERLVAAHEDLAQVWRPFVARFVGLAGGSLAPTMSARTLPLV